MYRKPRTKASILSGLSTQERGNITKSKVYARSTVEYTTYDSKQVLRYHDTNVVTIHNSKLTLDSGGFRTATTKTRINDYQNTVTIHQEKGVWYCSTGAESNVVFYDGIQFNLNTGKLLSPVKPNPTKKIAAKKKQISKLLAKVDAGIPMPASGDCFICQTKGTTCLQSHVDEGYLHGSLIVNALRYKGYGDSSLPHVAHHPDIVKRALRKYLYNNLIPEICCQ